MIQPIKIIPDDLLPGDVLLYGGNSFFDRLIKIKTGSIAGICHVEVFWGKNLSGEYFAAASRDGRGVDLYLFDPAVIVVRRPRQPFNRAKAEPWLRKTIGTPYGWWDLLRFLAIQTPRENKGLICSQFADLYLREGGVLAFSPDYQAGSVNPNEFLLTPALNAIFRRAA